MLKVYRIPGNSTIDIFNKNLADTLSFLTFHEQQYIILVKKQTILSVS